VTSPSPARREPIERILSKWRVASRTEAQRLVREGRVRVRGETAVDPRAFVDPRRDAIEVDGRRVGPSESGTVWLAMNKPRGVVTTTKDPEGRRTVMDLVGPAVAPGLAPVGRLDKASAGLLLLTNDHATADRLLDPASHLPKRYRVKVKGRLAAEDLRRLREDVLVEDGLALGPMEVEVESEGPRSTWILVTLDEGKNRQIRRRVEDLGHSVEVLVRIAIGPLPLGDLAPGAVRALAPAEIEGLHAALARRGRG
jgi:23S rRNA pseudouridine2605 synthase